MDAFSTISALFSSPKNDTALETISYPVEEESSGGSGTNYCVIA